MRSTGARGGRVVPAGPSSGQVFRGAIVLGVLLGCFALIGARLYILQVREAPTARSAVVAQAAQRKTLSAARGAIRDREGRVMAFSRPVFSVHADPTMVDDPRSVARAMSRILMQDAGAILDRLRPEAWATDPDFADAPDVGAAPPTAPPRRFLWLARGISEEAAAEIEDLDLAGVYLSTEHRRAYPNGTLAAHVLWGCDVDQKALGGVEAAYNDDLTGEDGWREWNRDGRRRGLDSGQGRSPVPGHDVRLTLDLEIQRIVQEELDRAVGQWTPKAAGAVALDPRTGEVLALANWPTFDPNRPGDSPADALRNRVLTDTYEPGSTMKPFIAAFVLQAELATPKTVFFCEDGVFRYRGRTLHDHHPYGRLSLHDVIVKSSNIGAAKLGLLLGPTSLRRCAAAFGFGESTGIDLPGEAGGTLMSGSDWSYYTTTSVPMGHEVSSTPLGLATAFATLANGGYLLKPQVMLDVTNAAGRIVRQGGTTVRRRVLRKFVARQMGDMLGDVVREGTGRTARLQSYEVGGKTGTSQKAGPGGYDHENFVGSFVGFAPLEAPRLLVYLFLDEPRPAYYGSTVAAPAVGRILDRSLRYLEIPQAGVASLRDR